MCDDALRVLKQIGQDNKLDYFADWGNLAKENFPCAMNDSRFLLEIQICCELWMMKWWMQNFMICMQTL
jgi:hypothetical protein